MRRCFITGLILFLPFTLTLLLTVWLFYFLSDPFYTIYTPFISNDFLCHLFSLISVALLILGVGFIANIFLIKQFIFGLKRILSKIPLVRSVFYAMDEFVTVLVREEGRGFGEAVLIPFPNEEVEIIGFIPRRDIIVSPSIKGGDLISVYIPGTINPLMGFLIFIPSKDVKSLKIKAKDAFIWTISLGSISPFKEDSKN